MSTVLVALLLIAALLGKLVLNTQHGEPSKRTDWAQRALSVAVLFLLFVVIARVANGVAP
jgi:hypothetical protein